jgi:hypothetical protein
VKKNSCNPIVLIAFFICLFFDSCGYRYGKDDGLASSYSSISVPYVVGDQDGSLTAAIIKEIVRSGFLKYQDTGGNLILKVDKVELDEDNIGFRYDRRKRGGLTKDVIPTEVRITIYVEISLTEAASCSIVLGPVLLSASVDYDHDYYFSRDGVNMFSLGQLTDLETAYDAVKVPLHKAIAEKIADYISKSW